MATAFQRAMDAAFEARLAATTLSEKREIEEWMSAIMRAHARGEDVTQFIPVNETTMRIAEQPARDGRMAQTGERE